MFTQVETRHTVSAQMCVTDCLATFTRWVHGAHLSAAVDGSVDPNIDPIIQQMTRWWDEYGHDLTAREKRS